MTSEARSLREIGQRIARAKAASDACDLEAHLALSIGARVEAGVRLSDQLLAAFPPAPDAPDDDVEVIARVQSALARAK